MHYRRRNRFLALLGLALFALAACAPAAGAGSAGSAGTPVNSPVISPTGTATVAPTVGSTPTSGGVTLVLSKTSYGTNETIKVTIKNGLKAAIFTPDHRSDCLLVQLQLQNSGTWQTVAPCRLEIVTKIISLAAGSSTPQALAPAGTSQSAGSSWPAGTYRIAFGYGVGSEEALTRQTVAYSATFVVS